MTIWIGITGNNARSDFLTDMEPDDVSFLCPRCSFSMKTRIWLFPPWKNHDIRYVSLLVSFDKEPGR